MTEDDTFEVLRRPLTEDEITFGRNSWIYCSQHLRPHKTGWCSVVVHCKIQLDATDLDAAYNECKARGLTLFKHNQGNICT